MLSDESVCMVAGLYLLLRCLICSASGKRELSLHLSTSLSKLDEEEDIGT